MAVTEYLLMVVVPGIVLLVLALRYDNKHIPYGGCNGKKEEDTK